MSNRENLARLILENPDLPVLCMVEYEVVAGDDCFRWAASLGESKIREYIYHEDGISESVIFWKENAEELVDRMVEDAEKCIKPQAEPCFIKPDPFFPEDETEVKKRVDKERKRIYEEARQQAWEKVNAMPWIKAIVVNIDLPEV